MTKQFLLDHVNRSLREQTADVHGNRMYALGFLGCALHCKVIDFHEHVILCNQIVLDEPLSLQPKGESISCA